MPFDGKLDLRTGSAYASLVDVTASGAPELKHVVPGDPANSFLIRKLSNNLPADWSEGDPMPLGDASAWSEIPQDQLDLIVNWIAAGAPND